VLSEEESEFDAGEEEYLGMRNCPRISDGRSVPFMGVSIGLLATELVSPSAVDWL
jgi:hypothetical protein